MGGLKLVSTPLRGQTELENKFQKNTQDGFLKKADPTN